MLSKTKKTTNRNNKWKFGFVLIKRKEKGKDKGNINNNNINNKQEIKQKKRQDNFKKTQKSQGKLSNEFRITAKCINTSETTQTISNQRHVKNQHRTFPPNPENKY